MPIEVFCDTCQKKLRVPDTAAGKRIKCPKCQGVIGVPAAEGAAAPVAKTPAPTPVATPTPTPAATPTAVAKTPATPAAKAVVKAKVPENWYVQTEDGEQYGPVSREDLDAWHAEGRVTADTQLLLEGSAQWQWATDIYPDLAGGAAPVPAPAPGNDFPAVAAIVKTPAATPSEAPAESTPVETTPAATASTTTATPTKTAAKRGAVAKKGGRKPPEVVGERSKMVAGLLGIFLGVWGVHNFYLGYTKKGVIQVLVSIFTCFLGGVWGFVEGIMILLGSIDRDAEGKGLKP